MWEIVAGIIPIILFFWVMFYLSTKKKKTMRHAYYLSRFDETFGDQEYGIGLKELYLKLTKDLTNPNHFDGVSRYDTPDGVKTIFVVKNFFDPKPAAFYYLDL